MPTSVDMTMTELKQLAPRLRDYKPTDEMWQQVEKKALEAREQVELMLCSAEGVAELRGSGVLQEIKRLVPEVTREEIAELKVSDFVLGMIFEKPFAVFEQVYRGFGAEYAKELSSEARKSSNLIKSSYVYGEIQFFAFADIIRWVAPFLSEFATFYDLGSGIGKAVIAASLPLVHCAEKRKIALEKLKTPLLQTDIDFITGSLLTSKWEDEWTQISLAAEKLKQGAFFISTTHVLRTGLFEVVKSVKFTMSWGVATVYIHRRRKIGRWAAQMLRGGRSTRTDLLERSSASQTQQKVVGQTTLASNDADVTQ
ncbi:hypothetical protein DD237_005543 [Peronospora effusa]|uniref:DOT1 domain-containing protein n=1 Tax=Peronospora effusa TaxID=542832 RepID=A0A425CA57_9STRA|nr:hypothetical protein DD237_005543 [Peronospora effusa]